MTNTEQALAKVGTTFDEVVDNILAVWNRATDANIEAGAQWYPLNGQWVIDQAYAHGYSVDTVAAVAAHLSPRIHWDRCKMLASNFLSGASTYGIMKARLKAAQTALDSDEPLSTLKGNKVKAFAANLLGDEDSVTVDVWAIRIALNITATKGEEVSKAGVYDAIADAYREAARQIGVAPSTVQATTWVVIRNGRS